MHTKTVLLVHDHKGEVFEPNIILKQRVGADGDCESGLSPGSLTIIGKDFFFFF